MNEQPKDRTASRRDFLRSSAAASLTLALPGLAEAQGAGRAAPSNMTTVGCIGVGGRGGGLLGEVISLSQVRVVAVCDVFEARRENATRAVNSRYGGNVCRAYRDLREMLARDDIDAVIIATPDHWHVPAALLAVRSGKDVYVEKPLALSVEELQAIRRDVNRYGRVFQYGTQQRSMGHVRHGAELIRNGRLGKLTSVSVTAPSYGFEGGSLEPIPVPAGLDYDLWLGPALWRPYTKDRCTEWGAYWCSDNAHGFIGGWGSHPLTDMVWAMGDDAGAVPVEYQGTGKFGAGLFDTPYDWDIRGRFRNGVPFHYTPGGDLVTIVGERGKVLISRGGLATEPASVAREVAGPDEVHLPPSPGHMENFIDCVRNRARTVAPVESAVRSDSITQLSMIALWTGRRIRWDPVTETIADDPGAGRLLTRALRAPWRL